MRTDKYPWSHIGAEFLGTAILLAVGLSVVILNFGTGSPVVRFLPDAGIRRLVTGFLFGSTGALIAVSTVGKISGAHINPVVTFAFLIEGKIRARHAAGYVAAQLAGAVAGCLPLLLWGNMGASVFFGATAPSSSDPVWVALAGETVTTFTLVILLLVFLGHKRIRRYTPLLLPFLYAVMVFLEAPLSGTSTNPARSLGPAVVATQWHLWWVYWVGPTAGAFLAVAVHQGTWLRRLEVDVAKLYHFSHDPRSVFHRAEPQ
ncbi:MAG TPA: aquaporin [Spirochaetia bacterium]|nr:aquaporin [Spirochaetia bacterium]